MSDRDVVATWDIALSDGKHRIQFEHGTTTGKRVILVDNVEVIRNNWMFRLVGKESFLVGGKRATIHIEAVSGFQYEYTLEIDGKPLKKFVENRKKTAKVWTFLLDGEETRMVLGKVMFKSPRGCGRLVISFCRLFISVASNSVYFVFQLLVWKAYSSKTDDTDYHPMHFFSILV